MKNAWKWCAAGVAMALAGGAAYQGVAIAAQDDRLSRAQQRNAVADAIATQCPDKARQVTQARCTAMGFDGDRYSCRYELENRFGSQMVTISNTGRGWRPTNTFNLCEMPSLSISARPQKQQFADAVRRECGRSAPPITSAMCSPTIGAALEDTFTCRYSVQGQGGQESADIYLDRSRWRLVDRGAVCAGRIPAPLPPRYVDDRTSLPGRYELAVAMFDTCPTVAKDLASAACEATGDPTEFACIFRTNRGRDPDSTVIAREGYSWLLIDIPNSCFAG